MPLSGYEVPVSLKVRLPAIRIWTTICHTQDTPLVMLQCVTDLVRKFAIRGLENAFSTPSSTCRKFLASAVKSSAAIISQAVGKSARPDLWDRLLGS